MTLVISVVLGLAGLVLALQVLTAVGARKRGNGWPLAVLAGVFFPAAWTGWYVADRPPRLPGHRA